MAAVVCPKRIDRPLTSCQANCRVIKIKGKKPVPVLAGGRFPAAFSPPFGPAPLTPDHEPRRWPTQEWDIEGKEKQSQGNHPEAQNGKEAQHAADDEQDSGGDPDPARIWLAQTPDR